jgi:hypothetical protein
MEKEEEEKSEGFPRPGGDFVAPGKNRQIRMPIFNPETDTNPDRPTFWHKNQPDPDRRQKLNPAGLYYLVSRCRTMFMIFPVVYVAGEVCASIIFRRIQKETTKFNVSITIT